MKQTTHRYGDRAVDRAITRGPLTRLAAAAALSLLPLLAAAPARAEVGFTVTNLGTLGGVTSEGFAINASGQVAGRAYLANGTAHATRWTNGVAQDLGTLGGSFSNAYGINDAGQVAGDAYLVGNLQYRAVVWSAAGLAQNLGTTFSSSANAVNNNGTVVGYVKNVNGVDQAVEWQPGAASQVLSSGLGATANAINSGGQIAGRSSVNTPFVWRPDGLGFLELGPFSGSAYGINDAGTAVGTVNTGTSLSAAIWQAGGTQLLGTLLGNSGSAAAYGINGRGDVVGESSAPGTATRHGFLSYGRTMYDLNSLLVAGSGAEVTTARAINVYGQIAGSATIAGQTRAVLLTPTGSVAWQAGAGSANGSFADATRWEQGFLPNKFVDASIDSAGLQTVFVNQTGSVKNLTLGANAGSPGRPTLLMTGGNALQVAGLFTVQGTGTLTGDGVVAGNVLNRGTVLPTNLTVAGSFTNQGLVASSGTLNAAVANGSTGQLRSGAGDLLRVNGTSHSNAGVIDIRAGGEQQYSGALANAASGRILLNDAVLRLNNGATNAGQVQVSFGGATVYGSVATTTGGKVILSGNSQTTFFDAVSVESGGELRVSNGSTGVFFGQVTQRTGALFTGTGTKFYEGGLAIGASPGLGLDGGNVNFGVGNLYTAEIGGTTACTAACATDAALRDRSYDKYIVAGHLALGGTQKLVSWAGFTGQLGQSFDLLDWGSVSGTFSSIDASGLALAAGAVLDTSQLYSAGTVSITAVPEPGTWALLACGLGVVLRLQARRPAR